MKVLILGANGMAGHTITTYFLERGYNVTAYTSTPIKFHLLNGNNIIGNAFDTEKFKLALLSDNYDVVINCIGILNQNANNNPSKAIYLNSYLPHLIADTLKEHKTKLIQMSTDCVFEGNKGPYYEDSLQDGRSFYDRTKALGEVVDNKNLTFRNSIIGPDINVNGIGLFNWFMKQQGIINGYIGAIWTGVTTLTLAKAMEQAVKDNLTGLYNLVNNHSISKYDLLCLFNKYFKNNELSIIKSDIIKLDKSLINNRKDFSFIVPSYEQMINEMKEWIDKHPNLYSFYNPNNVKRI